MKCCPKDFVAGKQTKNTLERLPDAGSGTIRELTEERDRKGDVRLGRGQKVIELFPRKLLLQTSSGRNDERPSRTTNHCNDQIVNIDQNNKISHTQGPVLLIF